MRATVVRADSGGLDVGRPASSESMTSWSPACIPATRPAWMDRPDRRDARLGPDVLVEDRVQTDPLEVDQDPAVQLPVSVTPVSSPTVSLNPVR